MDNKKIGKFIAICRKQKNITQQQLADLLGITNKAVSKWETGLGMPDISILTKLSETLDVSIDELIRGERLEDSTNSTVESPKGSVREQTLSEEALYTAKIEMSVGLLKKQLKIVDRSFNFVNKIIILIAWLLLLSSIVLFQVSKWINYSRSSVKYYIIFFICIAVIILTYNRYRLFAYLQYKKCIPVNEQGRVITYDFYKEEFKASSGTTLKTYFYKNITHIADTKDAIVFRCQKEDFIIEEACIDNNNIEELLQYLDESSNRVKRVSIDYKANIRMLAGILLSTVGFLLLILQAGYLTIGNYYNIEYIHEQLFYLFNGVMIILFLGGGLLFFYKKKKIIYTLIGISLILLLGNFLYFHFSADHISDTVISMSEDGKNMLVLKVDKDSGLTEIYRKELLWYARKKDSLPYTANKEELKLQWLTNDSCAVTYYSSDDDNVHQYIATYGDRGTGAGYYQVISALSTSVWGVQSQNSVWSFSSNSTGFTVGMGNTYEEFDYDDCVQFGTIALVLCKEGLPQYTIILNEDCKVDGGVLLEGGGSITLCLVSMEKTAPIRFGSIK